VPNLSSLNKDPAQVPCKKEVLQLLSGSIRSRKRKMHDRMFEVLLGVYNHRNPTVARDEVDELHIRLLKLISRY
jgi:hypothetical protein